MEELEGYDYEELIDKWGLRKKYKKLYKAIGALDELALISGDESVDMHNELGVRLLTEYIGNAVTHDDGGNTVIDPDVLVDMQMFLDLLGKHAAVSKGDSIMYSTILGLSGSSKTMFEFYRWFIHSLPLMWN